MAQIAELMDHRLPNGDKCVERGGELIEVTSFGDTHREIEYVNWMLGYHGQVGVDTILGDALPVSYPEPQGGWTLPAKHEDRSDWQTCDHCGTTGPGNEYRPGTCGCCGAPYPAPVKPEHTVAVDWANGTDRTVGLVINGTDHVKASMELIEDSLIDLDQWVAAKMARDVDRAMRDALVADGHANCRSAMVPSGEYLESDGPSWLERFRDWLTWWVIGRRA